MEDAHICCSFPRLRSGMEILDRTANPEGLSAQNPSTEDEIQDKNPISENVRNSGDHQIPGILAGLISKGKKKKPTKNNSLSVRVGGSWSHF